MGVGSDGYGCADGSNTCYHVNAITAFCLETLQTGGGKAIIPIAQIDQHFANSDVTLRLFDAGDVNSGSNDESVLGPDDNPLSEYEQFSLSLAAPLNSGYSPKTAHTAAISNNAWWTAPATGCTDYDAYHYATANPYNPLVDGPPCPSLQKLLAGNGETEVYAAWNGGNSFANGTWMDFQIHIPATYSPSPDDSWWKVLYNVSAGCDDTTTWEVISGAAPAHLLPSI